MSIFSFFFRQKQELMQENSRLLAEATACNKQATVANRAATGRLEQTLSNFAREHPVIVRLGGAHHQRDGFR